MTSLLSTAITGFRALPPRILLYGTDKIGKNTWAAGAPSPIVIQAEQGGDEVGTTRLPLALDYATIMAQVQALATEDHAYRSVILDSLDWIERLIWQEVVRRDGKAKNIEQVGGGYGKGYAAALDLWRDLLDGLKYLRNEKGMAIILICHHEVKSVNLPEVDPFDRYQPKLHKFAMGMMKEWADAILFAGYKVFARSVENGSQSITKGVGTGERVLQCNERPTHLAGNRYDLPDTLVFPKVGGFALFADHVGKFFAAKAAAEAVASVS